MKPTNKTETATAPTKKERVLRAAIDWVYNQSCSTALMELEDAVTDYFGPKLNNQTEKT